MSSSVIYNPFTQNLDFVGSGGGGSGTVTSVSVVSANGFAGTVANQTTTPAITLTTTATGVLSGNGTAISGSAVTQHDVLVGGASNAVVSVSPSTAGLVLTSNGVSADPSFQSVSASGAITSITGNSGGAEVPSSGNFNVVGSGSVTVAGSANTETVQLTGLTNHAVLVGAGTTTITKVGPTATAGQVLQSAGSSADPAFSTATYPATTTLNQILYSSANNVVGGVSAVIDGVLISSHANGTPSWLANGTAGFVLTANSGAPPSWQASGGGGGGITTIAGDTGSATGSTVTFKSLSTSTWGNFSFLASGASVTLRTGDTAGNVFIGENSGAPFSLSTGTNNIGIGDSVLSSISDNTDNIGIGEGTLTSLVSGGIQNFAGGSGSLGGLLTGSNNVSIGNGAGSAYAGAESGNILIGSGVTGTAAESNATHIGVQGTQTTCFIAGISGVTVTGTAVLVSATGQLGVAVSSERFKENIEDMGNQSSPLYSLRPVTFNLKSDLSKTKQYGLIAEEVAKVMPELVTYDVEGKPYSVHYHDLPALLLNELLKLRKEIDVLKSRG